MIFPKSYLAAAMGILCAGCAHLDVRLESFMSPDNGPRTAQLAPGYSIEDHVLRQGDRSIGITYARHPRSKAVILYCGGDAFHRSLEGGLALRALALEADVVLFDYPGYGDTTGTPGTAAILDTAVAVYDHVFSLWTTTGKKRVLYGFSMGGMVVAQLSQDRHADGVVLEATTPSVRAWARSRIPWPVRPLVRVRVEPQLAGLDTAAALDLFRGKVLLLTSRSDEIVPAKLTFEIERRLLLTRRDVRLVELPSCRHGAVMRSPAFPSLIRTFLSSVKVTS